MEMIRKITKTLRFEKDVIDHAQSNPFISSFPDWACKAYKKEFMDIEHLSRQAEKYRDLANQCDLKIQELKDRKPAAMSFLNSEELDWLNVEGKRRLANATFEGVYRYFVNKFDKQDMNRSQFKKIIETLGVGK